MSIPNQHILVVANETATTHELHATVRAFAADPAARVHVVVPALNARMRRRFSGGDAALDAAETRLAVCREQLCDLGLDVGGHVGDADPLQAIVDALATFPATEIVIATHPQARSNWLAHDLVDRALARFGLPTVHVAVDVTTPGARLAALAA